MAQNAFLGTSTRCPAEALKGADSPLQRSQSNYFHPGRGGSGARPPSHLPSSSTVRSTTSAAFCLKGWMTVETRLRFRCSAGREAWEPELWPQWDLECPSEDRVLITGNRKGGTSRSKSALSLFPSPSESHALLHPEDPLLARWEGSEPKGQCRGCFLVTSRWQEGRRRARGRNHG